MREVEVAFGVGTVSTHHVHAMVGRPVRVVAAVVVSVTHALVVVRV